jgi:hypothetical protein
MEKRVINRLPEYWENIILPLMAINDKLVLGGSLGLYVLDIIEYDWKDRRPDIDFSLTESLEEHEFLSLMNFFNLDVVRNKEDYETTNDEIKIKPPTNSLKKDLIILEHWGDDDESVPQTPQMSQRFTVDFFNKNYLKTRDYFNINYFGTTIKMTHPSITLSAKMLYATDNRVNKQYKHFKDIKDINWSKYFKIIKGIKAKYDTQFNKNKYEEIIKHYFFDHTDTNDLPF